jgi:hypothetical protein
LSDVDRRYFSRYLASCSKDAIDDCRSKIWKEIGREGGKGRDRGRKRVEVVRERQQREGGGGREMKERWGRMQDMCQLTASEQGEREGKKEATEREGEMVDGMG